MDVPGSPDPALQRVLNPPELTDDPPPTVDATTEYRARVAARLAEWQRNYDAAGVTCASPLMDEMMASEQVAAEMRHERLQILGGCLWVVFLDRLDAAARNGG